MNIKEQYQKAVAARGGNTMVEIQTGPLKVGDTFEFGGYDWQRVGETVRMNFVNRPGWGYGYAKIIKIDAQGFKTAKRFK